MLEDINPTDDEQRESQQRVRLPKRDARIGEAAGRPGSSTAGVIGGWLGAAATVGLSTASAGLSTVTGVAGATASAGLSTVTGVAGAVASRASGAVSGGGGSGGAGKDGVDAGHESEVAAVSGGGGVAGTAAAAEAEPVVENRSPRSGPAANGVLPAREGGDGTRRGHEGALALGFGEAGEASRSVPPVPVGIELGAGQGDSGSGRGEGNNPLEEVDVQVCWCAWSDALL